MEEKIDLKDFMPHPIGVMVRADGMVYKPSYIGNNGRQYNESFTYGREKSDDPFNGHCYKLISYQGTKNIRVHNLVWEAFNGGVPEGFEVDHINTIRDDNRLENLRLVTKKENNNNPISIENRRRSHEKRWVIQMDKDGEVVGMWRSTKEAQRNGYSSGSITDCCNGKKETYRGFKWSYGENIS